MMPFNPFPYQRVRSVYLLMTVILTLVIAGYFTWSENIIITQGIKVAIRLGMTALTIVLLRKFRAAGYPFTFRVRHALAPMLYMGYLFLGAVSFLWSTDPGYSALQWSMDVASLVFAVLFIRLLVLIQEWHPEVGARMSNMLAISTWLIIMIFLIGVLVNPDDFYRLTHGGEEARLGGFFMNPNELGMLCGVGMGSAALELLLGHRRAWHVIILIFLLIALMLTGSRSSLGGFLLIVMLFLFQSKNFTLKVGVIAGMVVSTPYVIDKVIMKQGDLEEVMSMTGRLPFWTALITEGLPNEPWFGFGFMRIAYTDAFQSVHTYAGKMTHNTFIQVLMNLGFVGLALVFLQMAFTFRGALRLPNPTDRLMFAAVLIPILINSLTEFGIWGETNYGILFWQLLVFVVSVGYKRPVGR